MSLTVEEENWVKEQYVEHKKWLDARALGLLNLSPEENKVELEKIYGKGYFDEPEITASK